MKKEKTKRWIKLFWDLFRRKKDKPVPVPKDDPGFSYDPNEQEENGRVEI